MLGEIETEAAFDAQEVAVDAAHIAVVGAQNLVIAHAERGLAAIRTVRTNGGDILHFPGPRFVAIGAAGKRADRANVNAHAALFAFQVVFSVGNDHAVRAAHADTERLDVHAFIAHTHATEAQNTARRIVLNDLRPLFLGTMNFFL